MVAFSGPTADVTLFTGLALLLPHSERPLVIKKRNKQNRILMTSVVPLLLWLYGPQKYLETLMVLWPNLTKLNIYIAYPNLT